MVSNSHWYYKGSSAEYDGFDFTNYSSVRWSHDDTEWLAEHTSTPSDTLNHLTVEQVKTFIMGENWGYDELGNELT